MRKLLVAGMAVAVFGSILSSSDQLAGLVYVPQRPDVQIARHWVTSFAAKASGASVIGTARQIESKGLIGPAILAPTAATNFVSSGDTIATAMDRCKLALIAARIYVVNNCPLLLPLLLIPAAFSWIAWITFHVFESPANVLSKISSILAWSGFLVAFLGGCCSYFLNSPYMNQIISWGGFAWIVAVYIRLTWAKLWKRLGATPAQGIQVTSILSEPRLNSAPNSLCHELLVVERWLSVIKELQQDLNEAYGSNSKGEQIGRLVSETGQEGQNFTSSQRYVVSSMRGQSANRRRTKSSSGHHRQDRHHYRRARCTRSLIHFQT